MRSARRIVGILILLLSLVILLWGVWPIHVVVNTLPIITVQKSLPVSLPIESTMEPTIENLKVLIMEETPFAHPTPQIPTIAFLDRINQEVRENRLLVLEYPSRLRVGDSHTLRLKIDMGEKGNLPVAPEVTGYEPGNEPLIIPDVYNTHNLIVEALLDMSGVQHAPSGELSETLRPGKPVMFLWHLRALEASKYRGTIWLHLRFDPLDGGSESSSLLSARLIDIEAFDFFGLNGSLARVVGSVGLVMGSILGLDGVVSRLWNLLLRLRNTGSKC